MASRQPHSGIPSPQPRGGIHITPPPLPHHLPPPRHDRHHPLWIAATVMEKDEHENQDAEVHQAHHLHSTAMRLRRTTPSRAPTSSGSAPTTHQKTSAAPAVRQSGPLTPHVCTHTFLLSSTCNHDPSAYSTGVHFRSLTSIFPFLVRFFISFPSLCLPYRPPMPPAFVFPSPTLPLPLVAVPVVFNPLSSC